MYPYIRQRALSSFIAHRELAQYYVIDGNMRKGAHHAMIASVCELLCFLKDDINVELKKKARMQADIIVDKALGII